MDRGYDYVIVGGGTAGCVLAARLSADPAVRVLVLEAGGGDRNPVFRIPMMTGTLLRNRYANWFYETEPVPGMEGRRLFWPRGKVIGGSSSINGMVYVRGLPMDFDSWAQSGLPAWSWDRVKPLFLRSEAHDGGASEAVGSIRGRVYELSADRLDAALAHLDDVEGAVRGLYHRVTVATSAGVMAWAYQCGDDALLRHRIASGDWQDRQR